MAVFIDLLLAASYFAGLEELSNELRAGNAASLQAVATDRVAV